MPRRPLLAVLALCLLGTAALFVGWWRVDGPGAPAQAARDARPLPLGEMNFAMLDQDGRPVGPGSLLGRPALVFFGFTHCPEVCPTTLYDISDWLDGLGADAAAITPVLITVDPERDTADVLSDYVGFFHDEIRAWSGSVEELERAAEGFRVRYRKVPISGGDYTMDHTASVFLFDRAGRFVTTVDYHEPREFALRKIRRAMGS